MKLTLEQHPQWGPGWWWDLKWTTDGDTRRVRHGFAFTKRGAIRAAKRAAGKARKVGNKIEMDL